MSTTAKTNLQVGPIATTATRPRPGRRSQSQPHPTSNAKRTDAVLLRNWKARKGGGRGGEVGRGKKYDEGGGSGGRGGGG